MARKPRRRIIDESAVGAYHVISRCVRRAFLMGYDRETKQSVGHRRNWIRDRMEFLAGIFMIDVLGYGVLSNHYHVILRNRPDRVGDLSDREVAARIWQLNHESDASFTPKRRSSRRKSAKVRQKKIEGLLADQPLIDEYRRRLSSISWFMNHLNHSIALRANQEDGTSGRFWEGRFVSKPIECLDQLFSAMVYVDLNAIRAGLATTPEESNCTSVFDRVVTLRQQCGKPTDWATTDEARRQPRQARSSWVQVHDELDAWLSPIDERDEEMAVAGKQPVIRPLDPTEKVEDVLHETLPPRASDKGCLPITAQQYVTMVDWMGRHTRADKKGAIPADLSPIFERLGLQNPERWLAIYDAYEEQMAHVYRKPVNTPEEQALCEIDSALDPARIHHAFR